DVTVAVCCGVSAPSPRLPSGRLRPSSAGYGEGRGEGACPQAQTRVGAPSPGICAKRANSDLSPQGGRGEGAWLELMVRDDGFGFAAGQAMGFGLRGMQERVQALGGEFAIEARNGCGTCVRIIIPLPPHLRVVAGLVRATPNCQALSKDNRGG